MGGVLKDLRFAVRTLLNSRGFTAVVILTLALGIGANTAVFSLFDQVILRLLPVERPRELVLVEVKGTRAPGMELSDNRHTMHSYPMYRDLRERSGVFSGVIARTWAAAALAHGGQSERAGGELVSGNFFDVLGVRACHGRLISQADDQVEGGHPVAVLSHGFWTRRFGARESIVGEKITLNGYPMVVIGVTPPGFHGVMGGSSPDVCMPMSMRRQMKPMVSNLPEIPERAVRHLNVMARLKPGVSREQAQAATQAVFRAILEEELAVFGARRVRNRQEFLNRKLELAPALQGIPSLRERLETPLFSVMALVGLVLLIACANVAGLLLARGAARSREMAIRTALGAGKGALLRQLLVESLALAFLGGVAGLLVASWTLDLLTRFAPAEESGQLAAVLNARVLAFNFVLAGLTGLLFGIVPALRSAAVRIAPVLNDQSAGTGESLSHARFRQGAVVVQAALSMLLLVAGGLFARSLYNLKNLDPGFRTENLLVFAIDPRLNGYERERGQALYRGLLERLGRLPGVEQAAAGEIPVLGNSSRGGNLTVEGYRAEEGQEPGSLRNLVSPGYFRTLGIPVVLGREFDERDTHGNPKVAVVNEAFVERYFGKENPLGRRLAFGAGNNLKLDIEIAGVVKNQKSASLREELQAFVYTPYAQAEELPALTFYLLTRREEGSLGPAVRRLVGEMDPNLPVYQMRTVAVVRERAMSLERALAALAAAFATLATLLAAVGLYGLMAHGVARRTREIGVRVALGADRGDVFRLVMKEAMRYLALGLAAGIPAALALGRYLESQLFGLKGHDPLVVAAAAAVLSTSAALAAALPARRAARVEPVVALRHE